ncbi:hypothetical protein LOAG_07005 [Loa loa]|uniref:Death domain-containing protein n=1 Tax=Loa loa TaxID=7209 RepID=A0A1I7VB27_LOALO|nr:hypothetical protein LOAG_07005 [Loa loa]EFO21485.1 hypothetical protein LOAG_07005 [Loa loa]
MAQATQHFKLLMYMKKPKPWRRVTDNDGNKMSHCEKTRNVGRICRRLVINHSPSIPMNCHTPRISKKKCHKRKAEPPFLIRNCISGHENWGKYVQRIQHWTQKLEQRERNISANSSSLNDQSQMSYNGNQVENVPIFTSLPVTSAALLRSFYTIWHIGRISRKSLKTSEETNAALKKLSVSPTVEKCLQNPPKGGITAELITDRSQLSKRALHTLSRWARMTEDVVQDGYESGYDDDPVEIWNRAITLAEASSYTESELNNVTKTTIDAASFSTSTDKVTPRRRSNRVFKSINLKD